MPPEASLSSYALCITLETSAAHTGVNRPIRQPLTLSQHPCGPTSPLHQDKTLNKGILVHTVWSGMCIRVWLVHSVLLRSSTRQCTPLTEACNVILHQGVTMGHFCFILKWGRRSHRLWRRDVTQHYWVGKVVLHLESRVWRVGRLNMRSTTWCLPYTHSVTLILPSMFSQVAS